MTKQQAEWEKSKECRTETTLAYYLCVLFLNLAVKPEPLQHPLLHTSLTPTICCWMFHMAWAGMTSLPLQTSVEDGARGDTLILQGKTKQALNFTIFGLRIFTWLPGHPGLMDHEPTRAWSSPCTRRHVSNLISNFQSLSLHQSLETLEKLWLVYFSQSGKAMFHERDSEYRGPKKGWEYLGWVGLVFRSASYLPKCRADPTKNSTVINSFPETFFGSFTTQEN